MRVAFLCDYFVPQAPGGAEWSAYALIQALAARGVSIKIITPALSASEDSARTASIDAELSEKGISIVRFPFRRKLAAPMTAFPTWVLSNPWVVKKFAKIAVHELQSFSPDVISCQGYDAFLPGFLASRQLGVPGIAHLRDYRALCPVGACLLNENTVQTGCDRIRYKKCLQEFLDEYKISLSKWKSLKFWTRRELEWRHNIKVKKALISMEGAVAVSQCTLDIFKRSGVLPPLAEAIYNLYKPLPDPIINLASIRFKYGLEQSRVILFVGRFSLGKGAAVALEAMEYLTKRIPGSKLVVAGRREWESIPADLAGHVEFAGQVDQSTLAGFYKIADVLVLPSRWPEPFSRVMLEAMSFGVPIIATNTGGNIEGVEHEVTGLLIDRNDPIALGKALVRVLNYSQTDLLAMGENAKRLLAKKFDPEIQLDRLQNFFSKVAIKGLKH